MQSSAGIDPNRVDTVAQYALGYETGHPDAVNFPNNVIKYVKATAAITLADAVKLDVAAPAAQRHASVIPTAAALAQTIEGVAHVAIGNGSFGWITTKGRVNANVTAATAAGAILSTSAAAAGRLLVSAAAASDANAIASGRGIIALTAEAANRSDVFIA